MKTPLFLISLYLNTLLCSSESVIVLAMMLVKIKYGMENMI